MKFIGHTKQVRHLDRALQSRAVPSALLFSGPAHVGKRTLAEYFARAIIDGSEKIDFSHGGARDYYGDLMTCAPISEKQKIKKKGAKSSKAKKDQEKTLTHDISVDQVRDAARELSLSALHGGARVLIIDDAERLGVAAQNAFLKTVEEPPTNAHIIFVTSNKSRLLPTLRSRTQTITFSLLSDDALSVLSDDVDLRVRAMGRPGLLTNLLAEKAPHDRDHNGDGQVNLLSGGSVADRLAYAKELSYDKEHARSVLAELQWNMRTRIISEHSYGDYATLARIEETRHLLRTNVNAHMVLEELVLHL